MEGPGMEQPEPVFCPELVDPAKLPPLNPKHVLANAKNCGE